MPKTVSDDSDMKDNTDDEGVDNDANEVITTTLSSGVKDQITSVINHLVAIDKKIAEDSIGAANAYYTATTNTKTKQKIQGEITKANAEMQKALNDISKGDFHRAVLHYKEAWVHAQMALAIK